MGHGLRQGEARRATPAPARPRARRRTAASLFAGGLLSLAGCAGYQPRPLPDHADVAGDVSRLAAPTSPFRLAPLAAVRIDIAAGLTPTEVAVLAVVNNPDLAAKRKAKGVAEAQVFAAGLFPDPQISGGVDRPTAGPDHETAYNVSVAVDVAALLARSNLHRAARFTAQAADLDLLWAEWSTAQQARTLAETALADERRAQVLRQLLALAADRAERSSQAMAAHDVTGQSAGADLAVKLDVEAQLAATVHDADKARRDLNALLNLAAGVRLPLVEGPQAAGYEPARLDEARSSLPLRRPDLLALKAGYGAQDANLRRAVLAQFPITSLTLAFAKDPAGVVTQGISGAAVAAIFNGGRGEVRVQSATREQLRAEYQARLDATDAEVAGDEAERSQALAEAARLRADVPRLEALARPAAAAYARRDIDSQTYLTLSQAALSRRSDLDDHELTARLAEIALETALFLPPTDIRTAQ